MRPRSRRSRLSALEDQLADACGSDAFGAVCRFRCSMVGLGHSLELSGYRQTKAMDAFAEVPDDSAELVCGCMRGAKVSDTVQRINNPLGKVLVVTVGGCMIETDTGVWDARLETQLQRLRDAIDAAVKSGN